MQQRVRLIGHQKRFFGNPCFTLLLRQQLSFMAQDCSLRLLSQLGSQVVQLIKTLCAVTRQ
ncbi:hypothetical protein ASD60_21700 [Pseudomonas sp. Root562]|nr:hypothetical protein ASD60_21700 [Pseudomonas sp. Root562]